MARDDTEDATVALSTADAITMAGDDTEDATVALSTADATGAPAECPETDAATEAIKAGPIETSASKPARKQPFDIVPPMALFGLVWVVLTVIVSAIIVSVRETDQVRIEISAAAKCAIIEAGYQAGTLVPPWQPSSPQLVLALFFVGLFVLRKYAFPKLVDLMYPQMNPIKKAKCGNYMLELVGTTVPLVVCSYAGFWTLLFNPNAFIEPLMSSDDAAWLNRGFQILFSATVSTYTLEMCFDNNMRMGLMLHHWVAILLSGWGMMMLYCVHYDSDMLRMFFALSLYMITEQSVFVEMLMYHWPLNWWILYKVNAWYYMVTRLGIAVISLWTWWDAKHDVWNDPIMYPTIVVGMWLFVPAANLILNVTQYTTVVSLFGIAKNVERRCKHEADGDHHQLALSYVFQNLEAHTDDRMETLMLTEWLQHCRGLGSRWPVPKPIMVQVFEMMDTKGNGEVSNEDFHRFWESCVMNTLPLSKARESQRLVCESHKTIVDFDLTLEVVLMATWLSCPTTESFMLRAVLPIHENKMLELSKAAVHDKEYDLATDHLMAMVSYEEVKARMVAHRQQVLGKTPSHNSTGARSTVQ